MVISSIILYYGCDVYSILNVPKPHKKRQNRLVLILLLSLSQSLCQSFTASNTHPLIKSRIHVSRLIQSQLVKLGPNDDDEIVEYEEIDIEKKERHSSSFVDSIEFFRRKITDAASEGFGVKARNVASTMSIGDVVVPLCKDLEKRQILANRGIYAGVEYKICELEMANEVKITTIQGLSLPERNGVTAKIKPAYNLREHLERTDWPVEVNPINDIPLWVSKSTFESGTMLGTLVLSFSYLSIAAFIALFVRFTYVPSPSMQPTLNPGNVVIVTRNVWPMKPAIGDVILFDPPSELKNIISASITAQENDATLPDKGQKFLKRVIAKEGERVGVKNSNPYVDLTAIDGPSESKQKNFRVNIVGPYAKPDFFSKSSWDRPLEPLGRNKLFVTGDNGFRSVDSRVWGALDAKQVFGAARWVVWPIQDFGPIKEGQIFYIEK